MTNKETIEWLKSIKEKYIHGGDDWHDQQRWQAVDHAIAALDNSTTVQKWIPVAERMPEERKSFVPGLGTVSKPVLVTWLDPTSDKPYPDNCFVREGITRNGEFTLSHINGDLVPVAWMPQPKPFEPPEGGITHAGK